MSQTKPKEQNQPQQGQPGDTVPTTTAPKAQEAVKRFSIPEALKAPKEINAAVYLKQMQDATEKALEKQPKVSFVVPLAEGETEGAFEIVNLNGYQLNIKKGEYVEIPKPIADILAAHYRINMTAGREYRIDRTKDGLSVARALGGR